MYMWVYIIALFVQEYSNLPRLVNAKAIFEEEQ